MENGALVISLDFELLWGVFDKVDWREKQEYFQNTRELIPQILELFERYEIHCTWATVGMLFNENWDDWNSNIPGVLPEYANPNLSAYKYGKSIQSKETEKLCFAPEIIRKIKGNPGQEVGTHTYSHYYCLEPGQTPGSFKADLEKSGELAEKFGVELKSLVFPRNQYNQDYLELCRELNLDNVRTNPETWYWANVQEDSVQQKIFRTGDAYIGFNDKSYKDIPEIYPGITGQKASRLLRPFTSILLLNNFRLKRIQSEMKTAAQRNEIYHLWWHPHNFGNKPFENLRDLQIILDYYKKCQKKYGFDSFTMKEVDNLNL